MDNAFINTLVDAAFDAYTVYPDQDFDNPDPNESVVTNTVDDMIIEDGNVKVRILETLPGLECIYDGASYISFSDDNYDYNVDYAVYADMEPGELVALIHVGTGSGDEPVVNELDSELTLTDGSTVYYSFSKSGTDEFDYACNAVYAKDLGNGACLVAEVYVYGYDVTSAELGEALLDKNFELLQ